MQEIDKEVYFSDYCNKCEHADLTEDQEPCFHCLENPVNTYSHKPLDYKEKTV